MKCYQRSFLTMMITICLVPIASCATFAAAFGCHLALWRQERISRQQQRFATGHFLARTTIATDGGDTVSYHQNDGYLQDKGGHINRELAERIFLWEQAHRPTPQQPQQLPKQQQQRQHLTFSVRDGLRLVNTLARDALQKWSPGGDDSNDDRSVRTALLADLVQEGLAALLAALSQYPREESIGFQDYATSSIQTAMSRFLKQESVLREIRTSQDLVPTRQPEQDRLRQRSHEDDLVSFTNHPVHDHDRAVYLDNEANDDDDDTDEYIINMIRNDLSNFLTSTLEPHEVVLVRLAFGLDSQRAWSRKQLVAYAKDNQLLPFSANETETSQISHVLTRSIRKLRQAYRQRYLDSYSDDNGALPMDSV